MAFSFSLSDELKASIRILAKKDRKTAEIINKKIRQIIESGEISINHYLKYGLKEYKRVHIAKSFVLIFKVFLNENYILFDRFGHHDDIYREK